MIEASPRTSPRCMHWYIVASFLFALSAQAQQAAPSPATPPAASVEPTTLDTVQALRPDEEVLDLDAFQNPITVEPNRFNRAYDTGISPEQMALDPRYNGYINYGINQGLRHTWNGIKKVTGMRPYETPAIARPPPLDEEQMQRAARASDADADAAGK